jgi:putative N6-adenine-specific DNA methylase
MAALRSFFATCSKGLEPILAAELRAARVGATDVQLGASGVAFTGSWDTGCKAVLWSRVAVRVLDLVDRNESVLSESDLYLWVKSIQWEAYLGQGSFADASMAVDAHVSFTPGLTHSLFAAQRVKDAVCDRLRTLPGSDGSRPRVDKARPDQLPLFLSVHRGAAAVYRDMCGGHALHKRGYRSAVVHRAALKESVAAGILLAAGWPDAFEAAAAAAGRPLVLADPMCGSGTLLIEGAHLAQRRAPGLRRALAPPHAGGGFPFETWPDAPRLRWAAAVDEARGAEAAAARASRSGGAPPLLLLGNDAHAGALRLAQDGLQAAGVAPLARLAHADVSAWQLLHTPTLIATNPPWGRRLGGGGGDGGGGGSGGGGGRWRGGSAPDWPQQQRGASPRSERATPLRRPAPDAAAPGGGHSDGNDFGATEDAAADAWFKLGTFLRRDELGGCTAVVLSGDAGLPRHMALRSSAHLPIRIGDVECMALRYEMRSLAERESAATAAMARSLAGGRVGARSSPSPPRP